MTENLEKIYSGKNVTFFISKTTIYLSLGLHKGCPSNRRSLQLSKENIQHFNTWNFFFVCNFCPPGSGTEFWIRIRIHWPDGIRIHKGSGFETLVRTRPLSWRKFNICTMFGPRITLKCGMNNSLKTPRSEVYYKNKMQFLAVLRIWIGSGFN